MPVMKRQKIRFTSVLLLIVLLLAIYSLAHGQRKNYYTYSEALDQVAVVVDGRNLTLADLAFYVVYEEQAVEEDAFIYNPENTGEYWNIHTNGTFVRTAAKETAMNMAIHDEIFYQLAMQEGIALDEKETAYMENTRMDFWSDTGEEAIEKLGVKKDVLNASMEKIALAQKYQSLLAEMNDADFEEYSFNGSAYEKMQEEHECEIKEGVWERVHFGSVTVAH